MLSVCWLVPNEGKVHSYLQAVLSTMAVLNLGYLVLWIMQGR